MINLSQAHLLRQLIRYREITQKAKIPSEEKEDLLAGACYGFSVVYSYMASTGYHDWWMNLLKVISEWDGKESSLEAIHLLAANTTPYTLQQLFFRFLHYIIFNQGTFITKQHQKKLLVPIQTENIEKSSMLLSRRFSSIEGTIAHYGKTKDWFSVATLSSVISTISEHAAPGIFILENEAHACSIYFDRERKNWHFYDPNNQSGASVFPDSKRSNLCKKILDTLGHYFIIEAAGWDDEIKHHCRCLNNRRTLFTLFTGEANQRSYLNNTICDYPEGWLRSVFLNQSIDQVRRLIPHLKNFHQTIITRETQILLDPKTETKVIQKAINNAELFNILIKILIIANNHDINEQVSNILQKRNFYYLELFIASSEVAINKLFKLLAKTKSQSLAKTLGKWLLISALNNGIIGIEKLALTKSLITNFTICCSIPKFSGYLIKALSYKSTEQHPPFLYTLIHLVEITVCAQLIKRVFEEKPDETLTLLMELFNADLKSLCLSGFIKTLDQSIIERYVEKINLDSTPKEADALLALAENLTAGLLPTHGQCGLFFTPAPLLQQQPIATRANPPSPAARRHIHHNNRPAP